MSDLAQLPPVERLQAVKVEPGDTLIASVSNHSTQDEIEVIYECLALEFPQNRVLVFAGVELWVGRNPSDKEKETGSGG